MLLPVGVLIKPLSCCWESKLYNQWIKNGLSLEGEERKGGGDVLWCRKFPTEHCMEEQICAWAAYRPFTWLSSSTIPCWSQQSPCCNFFLKQLRDKPCFISVSLPFLCSIPQASAFMDVVVAVRFVKRRWSRSPCCICTCSSSLVCLSHPSSSCSFSRDWREVRGDLLRKHCSPPQSTGMEIASCM